MVSCIRAYFNGIPTGISFEKFLELNFTEHVYNI